MQLKAIVQYQGALAHYQISPEHEGIYHARLMRYDGRPERTPPGKVTLIKGNNLWSGNCDRQDLLNQLGDRIEKRLMPGDPSSAEPEAPTHH
jgi:hypothetical protein